MFKLEKTYEISELVRHNMHTHTNFSLCAKPEMTLQSMIAEAERCSLKTLAITDHSDPGSDIDVLSNTKRLKEMLRSIDTPVKVLIGSELSAYGEGLFADRDELNRELDYRNYSHVHYHLKTWVQPEDRSPRGYAEDMLRVLKALFKAKRADCIAHPFAPMKLKFFNDEEKRAVLNSLTDNEIGDIMEMGEKSECAFEIHRPSFLQYPEFYEKFWNMGKEVGVHFNFGTDAHSLAAIATEPFNIG